MKYKSGTTSSNIRFFTLILSEENLQQLNTIKAHSTQSPDGFYQDILHKSFIEKDGTTMVVTVMLESK